MLPSLSLGKSHKPFVTLCQIKVIQGHEVKKVKFKVLGLGGVMRVFRLDFQDCKNDPKTLFETAKTVQNLKIGILPKSS